ncbi:hypothetical protein N866_15770 [Actinotalea ferrariae CF5-4]|uniref:Uncharacterized protein n=1 Tax=Actinotalea ferrariae CF5-4 TaxID=948458 RepID=A0A021VL47_9CELL|nr:Rv3235 family protein [Actinotalea ferrariae]EYR61828.1 hypothetical protein N866_15770 [Actinotalea ferrariae CF5-4]
MSAVAAVRPPAPTQPRATDRTRTPRAAATTVPGRGTVRTLRPRPALLLPPPVDPLPRAPQEADLPWPPPAWSVRSPLTEVAWAPRPPAPAAPPPLPDPSDVARAVVVSAVEALAGARPLSQLVRWLTPELHEHLVETRAARGPVAGPVRRAGARGATVCRISDDVAEATVVVHDGHKVRAAAVRLEVHRRRWRVSVLEIY